jgi:hypothetical protein
MDQSVMTFADSAARGSAIPSPTEGMVTYLDDTDALEVFNGTAFTGVGGGGATNAIINGAFEINQRGFSSSTAAGYGFDRFENVLVGNGTTTFSAQTFTAGSAPVSGQEATNFFRIVTTGQTGTDVLSSVDQKVEDVRTITPDTTWTASFYAKAGSGTPKIALEFIQNFGSGGSASVNTLAGQVTLSTNWQRFSVSFEAPSISGKTIGAGNYSDLRFYVSAGTDRNARTGSLGIQSNTFDIWGVQLEAGSTATPFRRNANSLQGELAACQRYYVRFGGDSSTQIFCTGIGNTASVAKGAFFFPVPMRIGPTSVDFLNLATSDLDSYTNAFTTLTLEQAAKNSVRLQISGGSGMTNKQMLFVVSNATTNSHLGFSAEL